MSHLSDDQFAALANDTGVSRRLVDSKQVRDDNPSHRGLYAVSYPSSQGHEADPAHPVVREQVAAHRDRMLADPTLSANPSAMQGGWPFDGHVYLDASRMVQGRRAAVAQGHQDRQLAVRDMSRSRDVVMRRSSLKGTDTSKVVGNRVMGYTHEPRRAKP